MFALTHLFARGNHFTHVAAHDLCNLSFLRHIDLGGNALESIAPIPSESAEAQEGQCNEQLVTVILRDNAPLHDINALFAVFSAVIQLDVANNPNLRLSHTLASDGRLRALRVLDVSGTQSDLSDNWCESEDELEVLLARSMRLDKGFNTDYQLVRFLDSCFRHLRVLDLSYNAQHITLRHLRASVGSLRFSQVAPSLIRQRAASMADRRRSAFIAPSVATSDGDGVDSYDAVAWEQAGSEAGMQAATAAETVARCKSDVDTSPGKYLTRLELEGLQATCAIADASLPASVVLGSSRQFELPGLLYECTCIPTHQENEEGECRPVSEPQWRYALAGSLGTLGALLLGFALFRASRYWRQVHYDLDLRARLIDEKEMENLQLREAWEVKAADVVLLERIDAQSPGTFSQVWRGSWLDQMVAVKVLNQLGSGSSFITNPGATLDAAAHANSNKRHSRHSNSHHHHHHHHHHFFFHKHRGADDDDDDNGGSGGGESEHMLSPEFRREVEFFMTSCRHKNVVQFLGAGCLHTGSPFIILELVPNGSLDVFLGTNAARFLNSKQHKALKSTRRRHKKSSSAGGGGSSNRGRQGKHAESGQLISIDEDDDGGGGGGGGDNVTRNDGSEECGTRLDENEDGHDALDESGDDDDDDDDDDLPVISWEQRMHFLRGIARGMEHIHAKGLVHRDLKTANVLVSATLEPKITDFGTIRTLFQSPLSATTTTTTTTEAGEDGATSAAAATGATGTAATTTTAFGGWKRWGREGARKGQHGGGAEADGGARLEEGGGGSASNVASLHLTSAVGTPLYMALEVLCGDGAYTWSADVWSFGVVAWELASQRPPLLLEELGQRSTGPMLAKMRNALADRKRLPVSQQWPEWLRGLLLRCWNEDNGKRPTFREITRICDTVLPKRHHHHHHHQAHSAL